MKKKINAVILDCGRQRGLMASVVDSGFEPWPASLCCVLGQNMLLSECPYSLICAPVLEWYLLRVN